MLKTRKAEILLAFQGNANDNSGNSRNGSALSSPSISDGVFGKGYSFDGVDDGFLLGGSLPPLNGDITMYARCYFDEEGRDVIFGSYNSALAVNVEKHTSRRLRWYWGLGEIDTFSPNNVVELNTWHLITFVRDTVADELRIYVDCELVDTHPDSGTDIASTGAFRLARDSRTGTTVSKGKYNEFRYYSAVHSVADMKRVMLGMHPITR